VKERDCGTEALAPKEHSETSGIQLPGNLQDHKHKRLLFIFASLQVSSGLVKEDPDEAFFAGSNTARCDPAKYKEI